MYKVTARRVRSSVVAWKSNKCYICWVCVCSLRHPAWNANTPYSRCVVCPLLHDLVHIMSQTAWVQEKKKTCWTQNVCWFSLLVLSEILYILGRRERDMIRSAHWPSCKVAVILVIFHWNLNFFWQIFEKHSNINVNKNPTRCNSKQIFIYCEVTLHVSGVTAPIIRSTKNRNRNLRYGS